MTNTITMFKVNDRVRFKDKKKDEFQGVLIILNITGTIVTCDSGDYATIGTKMCNADISELEKVE